MKEFDFTIKDPMGLHARPATLIYSTCTSCRSQIIIYHNGNGVFGQDVLAVMSLRAGYGEKLHITVDGPDEEEALDKLKDLFESFNKNFD